MLIKSNLEGSVLEALDLNDNKIKTFLINRIISIGEDISKQSYKEENQNEIEVIFDVKDDSILLKIKEFKKQETNYVAKFRNKNIAIEFFIENFTSTNVISPNAVKVDVMNRVKSIRTLLTNEFYRTSNYFINYFRVNKKIKKCKTYTQHLKIFKMVRKESIGDSIEQDLDRRNDDEDE